VKCLFAYDFGGIYNPADEKRLRVHTREDYDEYDSYNDLICEGTDPPTCVLAAHQRAALKVIEGYFVDI
jgi:hypothetical protein